MMEPIECALVTKYTAIECNADNAVQIIDRLFEYLGRPSIFSGHYARTERGWGIEYSFSRAGLNNTAPTFIPEGDMCLFHNHANGRIATYVHVSRQVFDRDYIVIEKETERKESFFERVRSHLSGKRKPDGKS